VRTRLLALAAIIALLVLAPELEARVALLGALGAGCLAVRIGWGG
jgi:hypothetical protein